MVVAASSVPSLRAEATLGEDLTRVSNDDLALVHLLLDKVHGVADAREGHLFVLDEEGRHIPLA